MDRRTFLAGASLAAAGAAGADVPAPVRLRIEGEDLFAASGDRPLLRYRRRTAEPTPGLNPLLAASGYLHPVYAPCGVVVTNHFSPDHPHQRGLFSAWTKTKVTLDGEHLEPDFWNIHLGTGRTRSVGVEILKGGAPGFRSKQVFEARHGERWEPVLHETWEVRFMGGPSMPDSARAVYVFDLTSRQAPRVDVELPKYHYGGMAVRGSGQWVRGSDVSFLNSEGKGRAAADQTPARWIDMSGTVDGKPAGIALLEHPGNLHAPNGVRVHPTMPYYVSSLPESGPVTLQAGREYVFRYRVAAHNGRTDARTLDALWEDLKRGS